MSHEQGTAAIIKAIIGNTLVTISKGIAAFFSGSGAMLAETIHSLVDTLNQCMLLVGQKRSLLKATPRYPYGFGPEASFWGLLAAIGVLIFGGALTIEHGIHALQHPEVPGHILLVVGILIFSIILEGWVLFSVIKGVQSTRNGKPWSEHLKTIDSGTMAVLSEDSAAVAGCFFALAAVLMCHFTQNGIYDACAQLAIGGMLTVVGLYLIWKNRGLLIGQAVSASLVSEIQVFIADIEGIDQVIDVKTRQLSAHTYRIKAEIVFSGGCLAQGLMAEYREVVKLAMDDAKASETLGRFANDLMLSQALFVDEIEHKVRKQFPQAVHIDLEPHHPEH